MRSWPLMPQVRSMNLCLEMTDAWEDLAGSRHSIHRGCSDLRTREGISSPGGAATRRRFHATATTRVLPRYHIFPLGRNVVATAFDCDKGSTTTFGGMLAKHDTQSDKHLSNTY